MTNEERRHLQTIKEWNSNLRKAWNDLASSPFWPVLKRLNPNVEGERLFDNIDWMISIIEQQDRILRHRAGVRVLTKAIEESR